MCPRNLATVIAVAALVAVGAASPRFDPPWSSDPHWGPGSSESIGNMKDKIKNIVVVVMENHSADSLLGGQRLPGFSNPIQDGPFCNPIDVNDHSKGFVCTHARDYDSVMDDPDHSLQGNNMEWYGTYTPNNEAIKEGRLRPSLQGFVTQQTADYGTQANISTLTKQVMSYYTEEQVPVLTKLCQNYLVFNQWFSDIPGSTNPNRLCITSGTSNGYVSNSFNPNSMPQMSIFQKLTEIDVDWKAYNMNGSMKDVLWYEWIYSANKTDQIFDVSSFFTDAQNGNLAPFTYIVPSCCGVGTTSMHPSGRISDGEAYLKSIYEALRQGPQWDQTLFIITFDETGGFHDHMPPPLAPRPDNLTVTVTNTNAANYTFEFNRLGGRLPHIMISPWIRHGVENLGVNSDGDVLPYRATSLLSTLGHYYGFEPFNDRIRTAPTFDHVIGTTFRDDLPWDLPTPHPF